MACPLSLLSQWVLLLLLILIIGKAVLATVDIHFDPPKAKVSMNEDVLIEYNVYSNEVEDAQYYLTLNSIDSNIATCNKTIELRTQSLNDGFNGSFTIHGNFLGTTNVVAKISSNNKVQVERELPVVVVRKQRVIDKAFTISIAILVSIIYINFGCALDWGDLKNGLKKPVGPLIGLFGQFFIMPLLSYAIGLLIFPNDIPMRLGVFFTGVSPAGGASNIWTCLLGGNISLSITMTAISTLAAFFLMPAWIFTLGQTIFDRGDLSVPYSHIASFALSLVVPLLIGYLVQRKLPRLAAFLTRMLKMFSSVLILFIVVFAIVTNLYLFKLFSWKILIAGLCLPMFGYLAGGLLALVFKQKVENLIAIAIETGIQNTGIAIFLLRFALPPPQDDLTTVAPVAAAIMTPLPLMLIWIYLTLKRRCFTEGSSKKKSGIFSDDNANATIYVLNE